MPKFLTKLTLSLLLSLFVLIPLFPVTTQAAGVWYNQSYDEWSAKVFDRSNSSEVFGERYTAAQVQWIVYSLFAITNNTMDGSGALNCFIATQGSDPNCIQQALGTAQILGQHYGVASIREQPLSDKLFTDGLISTRTYVNDVLASSPLIPEAKAQGFGFTALNPILVMWKASRNIAYSLFIVTIIIMAFMIMFRVKISPQAVITVQSALPKIVIALILVTFSYAIAGLLIDLMYLVIGVVSLIGSQFLVLDNLRLAEPIQIFNLMTLGQLGSTPILVAGTSTPQVTVLGLFMLYATLFTIGFGWALISLAGALLTILGATAAVVATIATGGTILPIALVIAAIILLIVIVILLIMFIRTSWTLLKAYTSIVLLTIFAPFQILIGVFIPGIGFTSWLKNYLSQLAIFVVTGGLFVMALIFVYFGWMTATGIDDSSRQIFLETIFGRAAVTSVGIEHRWPPLIGGGGTPMGSLLFFGASFVVFTMIPKSAKVIESFMKGQPFSYGSAIGEAMLPVKVGGLFAGAEALDIAAEIERRRRGMPPTWSPGWVQATKKLLGLRSS